MIFILTGNGKGKTTCAVGMGIRAVGDRKKVLMLQFLKTEKASSEIEVIKKIKNFNVKTFGRKGFFVPAVELKKHPQLKKKGIRAFSKQDKRLAEQGLKFAQRAIESKKYSFLILDEICLVLKFDLIDKKEFLKFLRTGDKKIDIVLTGRYCPSQIIKIADLVTNFKEVKHYYKKGIGSKKGIEY